MSDINYMLHRAISYALKDLPYFKLRMELKWFFEDMPHIYAEQIKKCC